ncbi:hypothetical protein [Thermococcus sp. 21S7]|uniref:hypothetical protein n=1 Tax=Thermococcus sp. 21S7 TaxID=1638221 RepID=UPI00143A29B4|nr:hypothetical protein [Thermococcus sp. 21S7]NJE60475.1 hypothetical protein [Thermococcus sp. 21S7]
MSGIDWEWRPYALVIRIELPSKNRIHNHQPQWERSKKQFRAVDPLGKPMPRELVKPPKFAPLWRTYHPIPKRW